MACAQVHSLAPRAGGVQHAGAPTLTVALVNNMPGPAIAAVQRQYRVLLEAAFPGWQIRLRRLTCLTAAAATPPCDGQPDRYDTLADGGPLPDALIVTGAEPAARDLPDEPIWPGVVWLADWAACHGVPVVWSCLAGHAAVRHLDGIERVRLPAKLSGVFASDLAGKAERVATGLPLRFPMPQSRYHGLPDLPLEQSGYRVLAGSPATGADVFAKRASAPFLFLQGHPEYEPDTLLREYRRDMRRYLDGVRNAPPAVPHAYFDARTEAALAEFGGHAAVDRSAVSATELGRILASASVDAAWQAPAARLIGHWLSFAVERAAHGPATTPSANLPCTRWSAFA